MTHARGKICFTVAVRDGFPPRVGGLAVAANRICRYLSGAGFDVHVVTYGENAGDVTRTSEDRLTVHRVPVGETDFQRIFNLRRYVRQLDSEIQFDLFHGFFLSSVPACMAAARASGGKRTRPVIASIRGSDLNAYMNHPYTRPLLLAALREPSCWVTSVNQAYLNQLTKDADVSGRCSVMRNGAPAANRAWQHAPENFGVVGSSGQFRKVKDIPLLVRAYRDVEPKLRRRLLLVGAFTDPLEESWSKTLAQEGGVWDEVELTGFLTHSEAVRQLSRMHVYVQPSAFEGMPNALLEAAGSGVPIVATAVGGVKEIFTHEKDALLVSHARPGEMTLAIQRVLENPALAESLATGAAKLCEVYSTERERSAWLGLHDNLIRANVTPHELNERAGPV